MLVTLVTSAYRGGPAAWAGPPRLDILDGERIDPEVLRGTSVARKPCWYWKAAARVGLACAHIAEEHGAGYFGMFAVRPGLQNAGAGRRVLAGRSVVRDGGSCPSCA